MLKKFSVAFQFLTAIPLIEARTLKDEELGQSMSAFPLVGLALGAMMVAIHLLITSHLPPLLAGILLTGFLIWATGGLHLDGVADTVDGLYGSRQRERSLEIMKDSRVGAIGAAAIFLVLGAKAAAIGYLPESLGYRGLLVFPAISRGTMTWLAYRSNYARAAGGLGKPYTEHLDQSTVNTALLIAAGVSLIAGFAGLVAFAAAFGWTVLLKDRFHARLGGITGDLLGFTEETGEIVALILLHMLA